MANLTSKQESFVKLMTQSEELARRGFELLLKRPDFDKFFDALKGGGLFEPSSIPGPIPVEEKGYFRVPYWVPLDYLEAVARRAGAEDSIELAQKVMDVVRAASSRPMNENIRDNSHVTGKFAEILGLLPTEAVTFTDIEFIPDWLAGRFERGSVALALDRGAIGRFLASDSPEDWDKAVEVLRHCTAMQWEVSRWSPGDREPVPIVDGQILHQLIRDHAKSFGTRVGAKAARMLLERVREAFGTDSRAAYSGLYRPAIEDHEQNHSGNDAENGAVGGLRDVVVNWCDHDPGGAEAFVVELLHDGAQIVRRIGIHILNQQWTKLRHLYSPLIKSNLLQSGHLHEAHHLLRQRFGEMRDDEKAATIEAIRNIPPPDGAEDAGRSLRQRQRQWLSALVDKKYPPAEAWYSELSADPSLGAQWKHPDFDVYCEVSSGPGPSPYPVEKLLVFANEGTIVDKLNALAQKDIWQESRAEAVLGTLEQAVRVAPDLFVRLLPDFLSAKPPHQYRLIQSFKNLWDSAAAGPAQMDWSVTWEKVIAFFEKLLSSPGFWMDGATNEGDFNDYRQWTVGAIAAFLRAGTCNDEHAFPDTLLPRAWSLIGTLLQYATPVERPSDDAMDQAIGSPRGGAIEALFSHALRVCRLGDRNSGTHSPAWTIMAPTFEAELRKCKHANFEFSTLAGANLAQLDYMARPWLQAEIEAIFPQQYPLNCQCALNGLSYTPPSRPIYALLASKAILDRALQMELKGRYTRKKLIERIALAYLWGEEDIESPRLSHLFDAARLDDLSELCTFFRLVKDGELQEVQRERVLRFWEQCIAWSQKCVEPPVRLLSTLGSLSSYVKTADGQERALMMAVAPYLHVGHHTAHFIDDLARVVDTSPDGVCAVLSRLLAAHVPSFDYEDRLKSLLLRLAERGKKGEALRLAEVARSLPGMRGVYDRLTRREE